MEPAKLGNSRRGNQPDGHPSVRERGPRKFQTASDSSDVNGEATRQNSQDRQSKSGADCPRRTAMDRSVLLGLLMVSSTAMGAEKIVWQIGKPDHDYSGIRLRGQLSGSAPSTSATSRSSSRSAAAIRRGTGRSSNRARPTPGRRSAGSRGPSASPCRSSREDATRSASSSSTRRGAVRRDYVVTVGGRTGVSSLPPRRRRRLAHQSARGKSAEGGAGPARPALQARDQRDPTDVHRRLVGPIRCDHAAARSGAQTCVPRDPRR